MSALGEVQLERRTAPEMMRRLGTGKRETARAPAYQVESLPGPIGRFA